MAAIRSTGNASTEQRLAAILRKHRISGWRRHPKIIGKPDFVFPRFHLLIFVDGCFWHGCPRCYRQPKQNLNYWPQKIANNIARDKRISARLRRLGWSVLRVREHSLKKEDVVARMIKRKLEERQNI